MLVHKSHFYVALYPFLLMLYILPTQDRGGKIQVRKLSS